MTVQQLAFYPDPIDEAFVAFHHANPHVYDRLVGMAREWHAAGHRKCSMKMLFEVLRWHEGIDTFTDDDLVLNNSFTSRYARLIAANHPDLAHLFETRALASERSVA